MMRCVYIPELKSSQSLSLSPLVLELVLGLALELRVVSEVPSLLRFLFLYFFPLLFLLLLSLLTRFLLYERLRGCSTARGVYLGSLLLLLLENSNCCECHRRYENRNQYLQPVLREAKG